MREKQRNYETDSKKQPDSWSRQHRSKRNTQKSKGWLRENLLQRRPRDEIVGEETIERTQRSYSCSKEIEKNGGKKHLVQRQLKVDKDSRVRQLVERQQMDEKDSKVSELRNNLIVEVKLGHRGNWRLEEPGETGWEGRHFVQTA